MFIVSWNSSPLGRWCSGAKDGWSMMFCLTVGTFRFDPCLRRIKGAFKGGFALKELVRGRL